MPIKTTNSYDIGGTTLGLRKAYLGANSQTVALSGSSSMSATWTLTLPVTAGSANQILGETSSGTGLSEWKTLAVGTSGTDFAIAHTANTVTYNLPDAGASARGAVTTGTQTIAGAKTFSTTATLDGTDNLLKGRTSASAQTASYIGEVITFTARAATGTGTSSTFVANATKLGTLTAGTWEICVQANVVPTTSVVWFQACICTNSTADSSGIVGSLGNEQGHASTSGIECNYDFSPFVVTISSSTDYFTKARSAVAAKSVEISGKAIRIA